MSDKAWRLIPYSEYDGATNMAIDEAILEAHLEGLVPPTLRLYGFKPAAITIGYNQTLPDDVVQRARKRGIDIVRRPTGGRAVLHMNELTYSFIGTSSFGGEPTHGEPFLDTSITAAYKQICLGLDLALKQLGLNVESGELSVPYKHLHDCFLATTGSDLHYKGKKLIGSAQLRRRWAVLQHGSILLNQDQSIMPELLGQSDAGKIERHANLFDILGTVTIKTLQDSFKGGFESAFQTQLTLGTLSGDEMSLAESLRKTIREASASPMI